MICALKICLVEISVLEVSSEDLRTEDLHTEGLRTEGLKAAVVSSPRPNIVALQASEYGKRPRSQWLPDRQLSN